jgi:hypothetical protein
VLFFNFKLSSIFKLGRCSEEKKEREREHPQLDSERHTSLSLPIINAPKFDLLQTDRRGLKNAKVFFFFFFFLSSSYDKWHEKECTFIDRMLLNIGDKAHRFLSIVLFGFINIRYAFVCIVYVGDQGEQQ